MRKCCVTNFKKGVIEFIPVKKMLGFPDFCYKDFEANLDGWQGTSRARVELQIMMK